jgi:thiamine biosynthesis protein ThiS
MKIQINGEQREISDGITLEALLQRLELPLDRVAVERNRQIVPRRKWAETLLEDGDCLEVVQLVGGGAPPGCLGERLLL